MRRLQGHDSGRLSKENFCGENSWCSMSLPLSKGEASSSFLTPVKRDSGQRKHSENLPSIPSVREGPSDSVSDSCLEILTSKDRLFEGGFSSGREAAAFAVFTEAKMKEGFPWTSYGACISESRQLRSGQKELPRRN